MIKIYPIALLILAVSFNSNAQNAIKITSEDMPIAGQTKYVYHDTTYVYPSNINTEAVKNGASQTWDFSSLVVHTIDTVEYVNSATTAYADSFPNSTVCGISSMYKNEVYFHNSTTNLSIDGFANLSNSIMVFQYDEPLLLMNYNSTYLDTFNGTSAIVYQQVYGKYVKINGIKYLADSVRKVVTYNTISEINGYGSVTTPTGTFDALKQFYTKNITRETYYFVNGQGWTLYKTKLITSYKLRWWANGYCYPIVECNYYPSNGIVTSFSFAEKNDDVVLTNINDINNNNVTVYPNPATSYITFSGLTQNNNTLSIYNSTGSLIDKKNISTLNATVNIQDLAKGVYLYTIVNFAGETIGSGRFNVAQ